MLIIAGSVGIGIAWGWLLARAIFKRWTAVLVALAGVLVQAELIRRFGQLPALTWFVCAVLLSMLAVLYWLRGLHNRRNQDRLAD